MLSGAKKKDKKIYQINPSDAAKARNGYFSRSEVTGKPSVRLPSKLKQLLVEADANITYVIETKKYIVVRIQNDDFRFYDGGFEKLVALGLNGFGVSRDSENIFELYFPRTIKY